MKIEKINLSYSQFRLFKQCPRKYFKNYIIKQKEIFSEALSNGFEEHAKIANILKNKEIDKIDKSLRLYPFVSNLLNKDLNIEFKKDITMARIKYGKNKVYEIIFNIVVDCFFYEPQWKKLTIIDWKTGHSAGDLDQLLFYANALKNILNYEITHMDLKFYYLDGDYYSSEVLSISDIEAYAEKLKKKLYYIGKTIIDYQENENTDPFKIKPNNYCSYCSFFDECFEEKLKQYKIPKKIENDKQVFELVSNIKLAETFINNSKKLIKEYLKSTAKNEIKDKDTLTQVKLSTSIVEKLTIGDLTKDDLVNLIIENNLHDGKAKSTLKKLKVDDLKRIIINN